MTVYLNCYVFGEGYTMKYFDCADGKLKYFSISGGKMPEWERKIFTRTGARLFLGKAQDRWFGCVRLIETGNKDENGRECYHNIAFEEELPGEGIVPAILLYARKNYREFVQDVNELICYDGADYTVGQRDFEALCERCEKASAQLGIRKQACFLVPEKSKDKFFQETEFAREAVDEIIPFEEVCGVRRTEEIQSMEKTEEEMELFFYCSTPSMGFVLKQIDFSLGNILKEGKEAARTMPDEAFAIMTRSGARMALLEIGKNLCFIAKNIRSTAKDRYGRQKYVSIAFVAKERNKELLRRFAAWALLDFRTFSERLTDCLEVFDGPKGYVVDVRVVQELLGCTPRESSSFSVKQKAVWQRVMEADHGKKFSFLLTDASLDYFNRMTTLDVSRQQISMLINEEEFQVWNKPSTEIPVAEKESKEACEESKPERLREACKESKPEGMKNAYEEQKSEYGESEKVYKMDCAAGEEERIDLLEEKWFRNLLGGGALLLLACGVIFAVRCWLKQ